ncbi:hypothetical protein GSI_10304 [Ganoderma sinense ZZ0214-1]|uniref:Polyketide synthase-like phosphopantetheine-binding domain-containing protein n=1 Tax=Ganoderma sinense ZZ0214-1 TaxID=1077348 RepID=A0A2G8S072_9APHY|nr:hypothetical protein GSI_10304 [Ganoderma sinense ZZ0214-1]
MFHAMGSSGIIMAIVCVFPPASPPTVPNPENVFDGAIKTGVEYMLAVPAFIESWVRDPEKVAAMKRMKGLLFGGAPLNKGVGNTLAAQGISLLTAYGSTEAGGVSTGITANPGLDWEYFGVNYMIDAHMRPAGDGTYELLILATSRCRPRVINDSVDGVDAYATSDLLEPHPTRPGLWKVYGRVDDQIMLSNGEKTNPGPLEFIITKDPHVRGCLFFGRGKFQNGVLIEPTPDEGFDPRDEKQLEAFRNKICLAKDKLICRFKAVDRERQRDRPTALADIKEMIMVTSVSKPFTYNMKGFPRRAPILQDYEDEIEALYAVVGQSAQTDIPPPSVWEKESVKTFVQLAIQQVLGRSLSEDADLFRNGCDSLQATYIRNTILRALCDHSSAAAKRLPMNVVFQAPSISALTDAVSVLYPRVPTSRQQHQLRKNLPVWWSASVPTSGPLPALQAFILARPRRMLWSSQVPREGSAVTSLEHLLSDDEIATVFAFNRKGTDAERQRTSFRERGRDAELLDSPKFSMVEADLQEGDFGLERELLEEIRSSVTHIMHNAWQVNFNLRISSFEGNLQGVRHLLELALSSPYEVPPKVMFVSSIGVLTSRGYSESKWVAEEVLHQVSDRANLSTTAVRLGQMCGDRLGHWNEKEWFPAVVKSALFTRCLPGDMNEVAFILSYPAARAFVEMRKSTPRTLHLVHPRPVAWKAIIAPIAEALDVPRVPYSQWLAALEKGAAEGSSDEVDAMRANPALRLLDFFRTQSRSNAGGMRLSTAKAEQASEELARMRELTPDDARRWVAAWRASGFLPGAE